MYVCVRERETSIISQLPSSSPASQERSRESDRDRDPGCGMAGGDESNVGAMKSTSSNGVTLEGVKFAARAGSNNRRRLEDITNVIGLHNRGAVMEDKNTHCFVTRRPMTRKYVASIAGKSEPGSQDTSTIHAPVVSEVHEKPALPISNLNGSSASTAVEVNDYEPACDFPLTMLDERDEMVSYPFEEVEMEDVEVIDIDSCDSKNPLAVVDYVEEIYRFLRRNEDLGCVSPNYMSTQSDINERMRAILIDWLIEVHYKFELMDETLFLTVNILDRFLARQSVVRKKLQLVGVTALLLACKYEEVLVPVVDDLIVISDRAYKREEVLEMEKLMVNTLQFNMSVPTPYAFMRRFLKAAQSDKKLELLSSFIIELCLLEYQMLKFRPSFLAAAAIYTAQCALKGFKYWTRTCEQHTTYSADQLQECSRMMVDFHQHSGTRKLTSVHRKYSTLKSGYTAEIKPALFLLDNGQEHQGSSA